MTRISLAALLAATSVAALSGAPAEAAVTVPFTFEGGDFLVGGSGSGSFTVAKNSGTSGLGDLTGFSLTGNGYGFIFSGNYAFSKQDLTAFSTTIANGVVTALSFKTVSKTFDVSAFGLFGFPTDVSFSVDGLGKHNLIATNSLVGDVSGKLKLGKLSVSPVPEPATWAMMIGGLGIAGCALRRRRSAVRTTISFA